MSLSRDESIKGSQSMSVMNRVMRVATNYENWLCSLAEPYLGDSPIEIGSGDGAYAAHWLARGLPQITVSEGDQTLVAKLEQRFRDDDRVRVRNIIFPEDPHPEDQFSCFVSYNVLEHIEDDRGALEFGARSVRRGGSLVAFVPAVPFAMSAHDRAIGHFRRYTKRSLASVVTASGWDVLDIRYLNLPGLVAWIIGMKWLGMQPDSESAVGAWDRFVVPPTRWIDRHARSPVGQSLLVIARRT